MKKNNLHAHLYDFFLLVLLVGLISAFFSCSRSPESKKKQDIVLGIEQLKDIIPLLKNKRVALLINQTSMICGVHLIDTLLSLGITPVKIFAPEHGYRGQADAGESVVNSIDIKTGIPITSLYGKNKKPTPQQLENIDIIVFDIQDVGARFYTYASTLQYMMDACAENDKKMMLLDRPNPNGEYVQGPVLQPALRSFVGLNPIPILHGMTLGELATMINEEYWLDSKKKCHLKVVTMKNYSHHTPYTLPIPPSPNLPTQHAIKWYPSLALFEGTVISVGRGTPWPFEVIGSPALPPSDFPFQFIPVSIPGQAKNPPHKDMLCQGIDLQNKSPTSGITLQYLITMYQQHPNKAQFFNAFFDKLAGNHMLREQIKKGLTEKEIKASWEDELNAFKLIRAKYLLYPD